MIFGLCHCIRMLCFLYFLLKNTSLVVSVGSVTMFHYNNVSEIRGKSLQSSGHNTILTSQYTLTHKIYIKYKNVPKRLLAWLPLVLQVRHRFLFDVKLETVLLKYLPLCGGILIQLNWVTIDVAAPDYTCKFAIKIMILDENKVEKVDQQNKTF